ncbi:ATP-binding protein [bacterium]|nr:ATP-binding protein [bacterium]
MRATELYLADESYKSYVNEDYGPVGKSASTEGYSNTSSYFHFWLSREEENLELGNIVGAVRANGHITFGVVVDLRSTMDMPNFLSDYISHDFGQPGQSLPTDVSEVVVARANVIGSTDDKARPVTRAQVYYANPAGVQRAFNMEGYIEDRGIPIGVIKNGDGQLTPIYIDVEFLLGPEGAHFNISGISGLATKTSLVEFMLKSVLVFFQKQEAFRKKRIGIVLFNVKGKDLLFLDKPNPELQEVGERGDFYRQIYKELGIPPEPFENVRIFAPYAGFTSAKVNSLRQDGAVEYFVWDIEELRKYLPNIFEREDWDDNVQAAYEDLLDIMDKDATISSFPELVDFLTEERRMMRDREHWHGHGRTTFFKLVQNLVTLPDVFKGLVNSHDIPEKPRDIPLDSLKTGDIFVIDIQALHQRGQKMVFERTLRRLQELLEMKSEDEGMDNIIIFIDELNKFAPRDQRSSLKDAIVDATARGRSLGLTFFGAEQFASMIDKQVTDNSSTICYGRSGPTELGLPDYAYLPSEMKAKMAVFPKGTLLLKHARFSQPVIMQFPYPPCIPGDVYLMSREEIERGRKRAPKAAEWQRKGKVEFKF